MTRLFLIRHAEAEGNMYRRIHGHYDSLLTPRGERQAAALGARFAGERIDAVYSSDLIRTQRTALELTRPRGLALVTDRQLREMYFGAWEDRSWGDVIRDDENQVRYMNAHDLRFRAAGGESFPELKARITAAMRRIAEKNDGCTVAVVAHGMCLREFLLAVADEAAADAHADNTAVSLLEYENGEFRLIYANDNSHLTPELSTLAGQSWWREENRGREETADVELAYLPLDMNRRSEHFERCRREAWQHICGSLEGYSTLYTVDVVKRARKDAACVVQALQGSRRCGIVELNFERDRREKVGCVSFLYLEPEFRGRGIGAQLIGYATSYYRRLGRERLRLRVAEENRAARRLYERYGFEYTGSEPGVCGTLLVMEKDIRPVLIK